MFAMVALALPDPPLFAQTASGNSTALVDSGLMLDAKTAEAEVVAHTLSLKARAISGILVR
jgi:hypothetical protein